MNVVIVNDFAHVNGGAAQVALASAIGLAEKEHRVTLFSAVTPVAEELVHPNLNVVLTDQHEIARDPIRLRAAVQGIWNFKARKIIEGVIENLDPKNTIIHVHGWSHALSSSVIRECDIRNFKVVLSLHDYFLACPNGGFFNFKKNKICHLRPLSVQCLADNCDVRSYSQKLWRVARQITQQTLGRIPRGISAFVETSTLSRQILDRYMGGSARVFQISNPIANAKAQAVSIDDRSPFLYVGRLAAEKGAELLAAASSCLNNEVVFVGDGITRSKIEILNPKAQITGWLPRPEVAAWINRGRCLVLPSLWYEAQPLVVAEAAAVGIPAIVPDTCAARELVENHITGLWFKGGDVDSLRSAMEILRSTEVARNMGQAAYNKYWENPPTLAKHVAELEQCYSRVLAGA